MNVYKSTRDFPNVLTGGVFDNTQSSTTLGSAYLSEKLAILLKHDAGPSPGTTITTKPKFSLLVVW